MRAGFKGTEQGVQLVKTVTKAVRGYEQEQVRQAIFAKKAQTANLDSSFTEDSDSAWSSATEIIGELYGEKGVDPNSKQAIQHDKFIMKQTKDSYHRNLHNLLCEKMALEKWALVEKAKRVKAEKDLEKFKARVD